MGELHLKQPGFTDSACGPFTKHRERIKKFRETGSLKHLYRNELGKKENRKIKKTGSGVTVNKQPAETLHKPVIKRSNEEKSTRDLRIIFRQ